MQSSTWIGASQFCLQPGDLLFQQQDLAPIHHLINHAFRGYGGHAFTHVALCVGSSTDHTTDDSQVSHVIEATTPAVRYTGVLPFLDAAGRDGQQRPRVGVFRLKLEYQPLVDGAIAHAKTLVGLPYNRYFDRTKTAYYCSELVVDSFRHANGGEPLFCETPMNFLNPHTGKVFDYWEQHYRQVGRPVPQGEPGSHPSLLTLSEAIEVVHYYGDLA